MGTVLKVKNINDEEQEIRYPSNHPKIEKIRAWIDNGLSPGYIEYLLQFGVDPHCNACRDTGCENAGRGDDACRAFKFGLEW